MWDPLLADETKGLPGRMFFLVRGASTRTGPVAAISFLPVGDPVRREWGHQSGMA